MHYDLVPKLPVEIIAIISQYLPLYQIFQARRVSKAWYHALTSPKLLRNAIRLWDPISEIASSQDDDSEAKKLSQKAEGVDALFRGIPLHTQEYHTGCDVWLTDHVASYSGGMFAWIVGEEDRECRSLDLRTGLQQTHVPEERCRLTGIAVSASMTAALSESGKCFVWTVDGQKSFSFSIPSVNIQTFILSGETLAIVFDRHTRDATENQVLIWTLRTQKARLFCLELGLDFRSEPEAMLDPQGESIVFFRRVKLPSRVEGINSRRAMIQSIRTDLEGLTLARHALEWHENDDMWIGFNHSHVGRVVTVWSSLGLTQSLELRRLCYDFEHDQMEWQSTPLSFPFTRQNTNKITDQMFYFLEDVAYLWRGNTNLNVYDFQLSTHTIGAEDIVNSLPESRSSYFGDDKYHVRLDDDGSIMAWCFDKSGSNCNEHESDVQE